MKTILVTGEAGYIGRHVVKKALDMGYRVIASDFAFKGVDERAEFCDVPTVSYTHLCSSCCWRMPNWTGSTAGFPPAHWRRTVKTSP